MATGRHVYTAHARKQRDKCKKVPRVRASAVNMAVSKACPFLPTVNEKVERRVHRHGAHTSRCKSTLAAPLRRSIAFLAIGLAGTAHAQPAAAKAELPSQTVGHVQMGMAFFSRTGTLARETAVRGLAPSDGGTLRLGFVHYLQACLGWVSARVYAVPLAIRDRAIASISSTRFSHQPRPPFVFRWVPIVRGLTSLSTWGSPTSLPRPRP